MHVTYDVCYTLWGTLQAMFFSIQDVTLEVGTLPYKSDNVDDEIMLLLHFGVAIIKGGRPNCFGIPLIFS